MQMKCAVLLALAGVAEAFSPSPALGLRGSGAAAVSSRKAGATRFPPPLRWVGGILTLHTGPGESTGSSPVGSDFTAPPSATLTSQIPCYFLDNPCRFSPLAVLGSPDAAPRVTLTLAWPGVQPADGRRQPPGRPQGPRTLRSRGRVRAAGRCAPHPPPPPQPPPAASEANHIHRLADLYRRGDSQGETPLMQRGARQASSGRRLLGRVGASPLLARSSAEQRVLT